MDAFAVALCTGLSMKRYRVQSSLTVGLYFGIFQALMPLIGYLIGSQFSDKIMAFDHWIAFVLLAIIGGKMVWESFEKEAPDTTQETPLSARQMFPLAIATSIDALAVGVSLAFLQVQILPAVSFIGATTFALSAIGVKIGNLFGARFKSKAEIAGGVILILIGLKILLEHMGVIAA
jgi:putative Mn2+ efflux pump MntP